MQTVTTDVFKRLYLQSGTCLHSLPVGYCVTPAMLPSVSSRTTLFPQVLACY